MGPEGVLTEEGLLQKNPEKISSVKDSYTGKFIREIIGNGTMKKTA